LSSARVLIERNLELLEQEHNLRKNEQSGSPGVTGEELKWLHQLERIAYEQIGDPEFTADTLAGAMLMGRTTFFKEVKRLTGLTPNQYIQEARLLEVRFLLEEGKYSSFGQVVAAVGMKSENYVSLLFRQRFGYSPASYFQGKK
jgi:AraC-like DNA-binding protein